MRITLLSYKDVGLYIQYWWKYKYLKFALCSDRRGPTHLNMIEMAAPSSIYDYLQRKVWKPVFKKSINIIVVVISHVYLSRRRGGRRRSGGKRRGRERDG